MDWLFFVEHQHKQKVFFFFSFAYTTSPAVKHKVIAYNFWEEKSRLESELCCRFTGDLRSCIWYYYVADFWVAQGHVFDTIMLQISGWLKVMYLVLQVLCCRFLGGSRSCIWYYMYYVADLRVAQVHVFDTIMLQISGWLKVMYLILHVLCCRFLGGSRSCI